MFQRKDIFYVKKSFQNRANNLECLYPERIRKEKESLNPILDKRFFNWWYFFFGEKSVEIPQSIS